MPRPSQWYLNDQVVNDYMKLIVSRDDNMYAFDSFFYERLKQSGHNGVKRWTKNVNIFSKSKIFIPINVKEDTLCHWVLICVEMEKQLICLYDSIYLNDKFQCSFHIFQYLNEEHKSRLGTPLPLAVWDFKCPKHPIQDNGIDCGVFVCTFAEYLSRNCPFTFNHTHMRSFRQLIAFELTTRRLVHIDPNETDIDGFIRRVLN